VTPGQRRFHALVWPVLLAGLVGALLVLVWLRPGGAL